MERIVKRYNDESKRKMVMGIKKIKKTHTEQSKRLENELYARVKAGEACAMCGKDNDLCTCGVNDDWREEEQQKSKEQ